jgi:2-haloacid dehalogenase
MSIDFTAAKALTFDCYGTLIDWESGMCAFFRPRLEAAGLDMPDDLVLTAFGLYQERYQRVRPALLYPEILRRSWIEVQLALGLPRDEAEAQAFAASIGDWPAFPDSPVALTALSKRFKLVILSNVDNASLAKSMQRLEAPFHATVTAEDVGAYKPEHPHFERAIALLKKDGIARSEIVHVGQSKFHDIRPARELGLPSVFVYRRHGKHGTGASLAADIEATLTVDSMQALAEAAGCL